MHANQYRWYRKPYSPSGVILTSGEGGPRQTNTCVVYVCVCETGGGGGTGFSVFLNI